MMESKKEEPMDDLISRQAAIDAVEKSMQQNPHKGGREACCHEYEHRHFIKMLMDLPSVQPDLTRLAQELWTKTCLITDSEGLEHQVIHTTDIKMVFEEVTGWMI